MRQAAGRETGDLVNVKLELDTASRILAAPADLTRALRAAGQMKEFLAETPSHRKEILRWVCGTKHATTRQRRIDRAVEHFKNRDLPVAHRRSR